MKKSVCKAWIKRDGIEAKAYAVLSDEVEGKRNASYLINLLCNNGFSERHIWKVTTGQATTRQLKAAIRCIKGRHYDVDVYEKMLEFLNYPGDFNRVIPMKQARRWINATQNETRPTLTDAELAEINRNF